MKKRPTNQRQFATWVEHAGRKVKELLKSSGIQRNDVCSDGRISQRQYDRIRAGSFGTPDDWLASLSHVFDLINDLRENPPVNLKRPSRPRCSWRSVFGSDFPLPPGTVESHPGSLDSGASEVGIDWQRRSVIPYEELLKQTLAKAARVGDSSKERQILEKLCALYEATANWLNAINYLQRLRELNERFLDHGFVADTSLRLGIAHYRIGNWKETAVTIAKGLAAVDQHRETLGGSRTELRLLGYSALAHLRQNKPALALSILDEQVKPLVKQHESVYVKGTYHHRRAIVLMALGRTAEARDDFKIAIIFRFRCGAVSEVSRTLYFLGELYSKEGKPLQAILIWRICVRRHYAFEDAIGVARAYLSLGWAYLRLWREHAAATATRLHSQSNRELFRDREEWNLIKKLSELPSTGVSDRFSTSMNIEEIKSLIIDSFERACHWAERATDASIRSRALVGLREAQKSVV